MYFSKLLNSNRILFGSLAVIVIVLAVFRFQANPLNFSNLFSSTKSGIITFEADTSQSVGQSFNLSVLLDTNNQNVNAVGVYLKYNPGQLRLEDLDTRKSFCQFYPEKKFDNNIGTVSLACGSPHPGVSGSSTLMVLKFTPLAVGQPVIQLAPNSKILLSDGKGTNILKESSSIRFNVVTDL